MGATVVRLAATANRPFHITGLRIEQVLYRPEGASSEIGFYDPTTFEPLAPFFLELPGGAVIDVADTGVASVFEIDLATVAGPWAGVDADIDGTPFPDDQNEVVPVSTSLFVEGYVGDGTVITADDFPAPVRLYFTLEHRA